MNKRKGSGIMDDVVARPRYPRRNIPAKRRRRNARESITFAENLMRQVVLALIILVVIGIIKSVNTPVTNYLSDKTKYFMSQDIQLKELYTKANTFLDNLFNPSDKKAESASISENSNTNENAANMDSGVSSSEVNENTAVEENSESRIQDESLVQDESWAQFDDQSQAEAQAQDLDTKQIIDSIKNKYSFLTPVEGSVTSPFGERIHPVWKTQIFHSGVDIEAKKGVPIKAALSGKVIEASSNATYGKYIRMEHEDGIITLYGHCSQLLVKKGQIVEKGKTIAKVGNTGVTVGAHLHFEIWKDGKPLDPLEFIKVQN
jgi:murein DD-endopeptidase MepM/ murein hydrolase activator NlpD